MDTLGTILPHPAIRTETEQRTEAIERLSYLAHSGTCGLVNGPAGSGKSWCLGQLAARLRREGISAAQLNLAAVSPHELPWLVSARLGSGLAACSDSLECWMWLQDYAESCCSLRRSLAFLVDHLERSEDAVIGPLSRIMDAFGGSCSWIFAASDSITPAWQSFLNRRVWLRVEMQHLAPRESQQLLSRDLLERGCAARFTLDGIQAAQQLAGGRIRRLQQIAELASLASETEGITQIDAAVVRALAAELV